MRRRLVKCCFGLGFLSLLAGCGKPVAQSEVPGMYLADYGFATDAVTINDGGRFTQTIKLKNGGKAVTTNGTWRFDSRDRDIYFSEEFMVVVDGFGEMVTNFDTPTRKAISILPVRRSFGTMRIGDDPRTPYKKQMSTPP